MSKENGYDLCGRIDVTRHEDRFRSRYSLQLVQAVRNT